MDRIEIIQGDIIRHEVDAIGYPADQAAEIAVDTIRETLADLPEIEKVILFAFDAFSKTHLESALRRAQS